MKPHPNPPLVGLTLTSDQRSMLEELARCVPGLYSPADVLEYVIERFRTGFSWPGTKERAVLISLFGSEFVVRQEPDPDRPWRLRTRPSPSEKSETGLHSG